MKTFPLLFSSAKPPHPGSGRREASAVSDRLDLLLSFNADASLGARAHRSWDRGFGAFTF
jgi:hypothetical protein